MQSKLALLNTLNVGSSDAAVELVKEAATLRGVPVRQFTLMDVGESVFDVYYDGTALLIEGNVVDTLIDAAARAGKLFTRTLN